MEFYEQNIQFSSQIFLWINFRRLAIKNGKRERAPCSYVTTYMNDGWAFGFVNKAIFTWTGKTFMMVPYCHQLPREFLIKYFFHQKVLILKLKQVLLPVNKTSFCNTVF